jgi:hypothetical protein
MTSMRKKKSKPIKCNKAKNHNARMANFHNGDLSKTILVFDLVDYLAKM